MKILYRDEALAAVEKPAGLPSEPTRDPARPSALGRARDALGLGSAAFLGLPHRLDRDTSGVLLVALSEEALAGLGAAFADRAAQKIYLARVHGRVARDEQRIESFLAPVGKKKGIEIWGGVRAGGKKAITVVHVRARGEATTLVECALLTGRTHQARVHLASLGHPIVGDELYGAPAGEHTRIGRHLLHAWKVEVPHPTRAGETVCVESPLPPEMG